MIQVGLSQINPLPNVTKNRGLSLKLNQGTIQIRRIQKWIDQLEF